MKRLLTLALFMVVLLAACGNKLDGTYENDKVMLEANDETEKVELTFKLENTGFSFFTKEDVSFEGKIDKKENKIIIREQGEVFKMDYKVEKDKVKLVSQELGIEDELTKVEE